MMFPESELLAVDLVNSRNNLSEQNRAQVRAIVLTHGHEEITSAAPAKYLEGFLNVPVARDAIHPGAGEKRLGQSGGLLDSTTLREVNSRAAGGDRPFEV